MLIVQQQIASQYFTMFVLNVSESRRSPSHTLCAHLPHSLRTPATLSAHPKLELSIPARQLLVQLSRQKQVDTPTPARHHLPPPPTRQRRCAIRALRVPRGLPESTLVVRVRAARMLRVHVE